jgi:hypothetical protein
MKFSTIIDYIIDGINNHPAIVIAIVALLIIIFKK